jgi:hypothetical protein
MQALLPRPPSRPDATSVVAALVAVGEPPAGARRVRAVVRCFGMSPTVTSGAVVAQDGTSSRFAVPYSAASPT